MTENVNTAASKGQKAKKAGIAGAGLLGIGVLASVAVLGTGANWQDQESVGADFDSGSFNLQVSTATTDGFVDGDTVDPIKDLGIYAGPWGPGDTASSSFELRLEPGTTHDAVIDLQEEVDTASEAGWEITVTDSEGVDVTSADWDNDIATGEVLTFGVEVEFLPDPSNQFQDKETEVAYTFGAESVTNGDLTID